MTSRNLWTVPSLNVGQGNWVDTVAGNIKDSCNLLMKRKACQTLPEVAEGNRVPPSSVF